MLLHRTNFRAFAALLFAGMCVAIITGCASLGVSSPDTFNKQLIASYTTIGTVAQSAGTLYTAGKITKAQKDDVVAKLKTAVAATDAAASVGKTDPGTATTTLQQIIVGLTALQSLLATQQLGGT